MQKIIYSIATLIILTLFSSCRTDRYEEIIDIDRPKIEQISFVDASVQGIVLDINDQPISDALVVWGETSTFTDVNGVFSQSSLVRNKHAVLEISKNGYFDGYKVLQTFSSEVSEIKVKLIERNLSGTINAQTGGTVEIDQGGKIEFADGFQYTDGSPYEGEVEVYAFYLNPIIEDFEYLLPGNQIAINSEDERQVLESYGMLNVEIQDVQGNKLQITKPAIITSRIPESLQGSAPSSIPLWYFDITDKYWKEEGSAIKDDQFYVGEVDHFTWWNCDVPRNLVYLEGTIAPIRGSEWDHTVKLTILSSGTIGITSISQEGSFAGFVPKNENMLLEILNLCSEVIYSTEIGPFDEDVNLQLVIPDADEMNWLKLSGQLVDCDNNPVSNGYISLFYAGQTIVIFADDQGQFSEVLPECNFDEIVFTAVDLTNFKNTVAEEISFESDLELNQVRVCEDIIGEFSMILNGDLIMGDHCDISRVDPVTLFIYNMTFIHEQEAGMVTYTWNMTLPSLGSINWIYIDHFGFPPIIQGNPEYVFEFDSIGLNPQVIVDLTGQVGSIFHFITNAEVLNTVTNETFEDVDIEFKAVIRD